MKINMQTCPNGHYFNADIYDTCPECDAEAEIKNSGPKMRTCPNGHRYCSDVYICCPDCGADADPAIEIWKGMLICPNGHWFNGERYSYCPECGIDAKKARPTPSSCLKPGRIVEYGLLPLEPVRRETGPVVGWLVCMEGPMRGTDFRLHDGYNFIGRYQGDICLSEDPAVSDGKHAVVSFYSRRRAFYTCPADSRYSLEVNGERISNHAQLRHGDILTVGDTKLKLVAFCDENFLWDQQP